MQLTAPMLLIQHVIARTNIPSEISDTQPHSARKSSDMTYRVAQVFSKDESEIDGGP